MPDRVLLVGPLGDAPWMPAHEVAERLRARGFDVDVHNPATGDDVIAYPEPFNPRRKSESALPAFLLDRVRAFLRWRRVVRRVLRDYQSLVVWDPLIAVMLRFARPRKIRVIWTNTRGVIDDSWNAWLARLARTVSDRMVSADGEAWYDEVLRP